VSDKDKVQVRVEFEGELLEKVDALKKYYGVQSYAELVRVLINEQSRQLFEQKKGSVS
jgi:metal-responsive CopG/Arc/MetJ family transcriptional regulator